MLKFYGLENNLVITKLFIHLYTCDFQILGTNGKTLDVMLDPKHALEPFNIDQHYGWNILFCLVYWKHSQVGKFQFSILFLSQFVLKLVLQKKFK